MVILYHHEQQNNPTTQKGDNQNHINNPDAS